MGDRSLVRGWGSYDCRGHRVGHPRWPVGRVPDCEAARVDDRGGIPRVQRARSRNLSGLHWAEFRSVPPRVRAELVHVSAAIHLVTGATPAGIGPNVVYGIAKGANSGMLGGATGATVSF